MIWEFWSVINKPGMWEMEIGFGRLTKPAIEKLIFLQK